MPQPRARVSTRGGFARAYVPAKHPVHAYRRNLRAAAIEAGLRSQSGAVSVVIDFVFVRPKSHLNKIGLKPNAPQLPIPDIDNLCKAVLDAIGPIIGNDKQVGRMVLEKSYGATAGTTVRVT